MATAWTVTRTGSPILLTLPEKEHAASGRPGFGGIYERGFRYMAFVARVFPSASRSQQLRNARARFERLHWQLLSTGGAAGLRDEVIDVLPWLTSEEFSK